jgi:endothelin-converting enzyme/putative endopeptidase
MTVPTVNAYYDPSINEMVFPAGALAPQTFDASGDLASNYGSLGGSWAGHELTHGFDDEGRHYDAAGNLRDWWAPIDSVRFNEQAALIVNQFSGYIQVDTLHVNGKLTLGENLGDLSGVEAAYAAYKKYTAKHGEPPVIDGLTGDQRFFIAYAQAWQEKDREDAERQQIITDPHSPGKYRVNGVVRNVDAWYKAFNVQPGDKLYLPPEQRVHIW